jgi:eukaryotic-like serine/threonine-protein kinase
MKDPIPFGSYLLLDRLDVGGTAEVFLARGPSGGLCAVKRLLPGMEADPEVVGMFLGEARLTSRLSHPGTVEVLDVGRVGSSYFIAMEYVAGADLAAVLARLAAAGRRMEPDLCAWVAREAALALDHAHRCAGPDGRPLGLVHRDVSPQNVLLSWEGAVKLIDFGIARAGPERRGEEGVLRGKVSYMSPEQAVGRPTDRRSDVFALGAVLHEMLTGHRLYRGDSPLAILDRIRSTEVEPPSRLAAGVPPALDRAVLRALARDPEERHPWAGDLAAELAPLAGAEGRTRLAALLAAVLPDERARDRARAAT